MRVKQRAKQRTEMEAHANELVKACNRKTWSSIDSYKDATWFMNELTCRRWLRPASFSVKKGDYVLRDAGHGSPTLLLGMQEVVFQSINFARACADAYMRLSYGLRPQILRVVE